MRNQATTFALLAALSLGTLSGCQTTREMYYNAWESMGYAKRERLVDEVKQAQVEQTAAKEQFVSALDQFKQATNFEGGELEQVYNNLKGAYDDAAAQAEDVRSQVQTVKNVGVALFDEWEDEIAQIQNGDLRRKSERIYDDTYAGYEKLVTRMDRAAESMDPVLTEFNDRVLFIKTNLNAMAIRSLEGVEVELGDEIERLIEEMEASIREADEFISQIEG